MEGQHLILPSHAPHLAGLCGRRGAHLPRTQNRLLFPYPHPRPVRLDDGLCGGVEDSSSYNRPMWGGMEAHYEVCPGLIVAFLAGAMMEGEPATPPPPPEPPKKQQSTEQQGGGGGGWASKFKAVSTGEGARQGSHHAAMRESSCCHV